MDVAYPLAPFFGWLVAGSLKFVINSIRARRLALDLIGYGGMPSTHTAIVATPAVLIGLREGWGTPAFSVAAALTFVVALDAAALRMQVQAHAAALNRLRSGETGPRLRERWGHSRLAVLAGLLVGAASAVVLDWGTRLL